ncbi:MAG: hypothetical protein E4H16_01510, partial [Candidatus Atribacteria bacterium]
MRIIRLSAVVVLSVIFVVGSGCSDELSKCKNQNVLQQQQLNELSGELQAERLKADQYKRQLDAAGGLSGAEVASLKEKVAAMEADIEKKKKLISDMQQQLLYGGAQIPPELSSMLEEFAKKENSMVTYDAARGIVRFKSDLLFQKGSDVVASEAEKAVAELCKILSTPEAEKFDVIIAGHTDDIPIGKPETRQKHPTNWHLSVHRAIS